MDSTHPHCAAILPLFIFRSVRTTSTCTVQDVSCSSMGIRTTHELARLITVSLDVHKVLVSRLVLRVRDFVLRVGLVRYIRSRY